MPSNQSETETKKTPEQKVLDAQNAIKNVFDRLSS